MPEASEPQLPRKPEAVQPRLVEESGIVSTVKCRIISTCMSLKESGAWAG